jgi:hypothetical protein
MEPTSFPSALPQSEQDLLRAARASLARMRHALKGIMDRSDQAQDYNARAGARMHEHARRPIYRAPERQTVR